jgi:hypothetical protein
VFEAVYRLDKEDRELFSKPAAGGKEGYGRRVFLREDRY